MQLHSDNAYLDNYMLLISPAVGVNNTMCGREPWSKTVPCVRKQIS